MPITTAEGELPVRSGGFFEINEGFDQADVVFSRVFEAGDVEKVRCGDVVFFRGPGAGGVNVARRTIAKYRESLGIPPSNERKRLV